MIDVEIKKVPLETRIALANVSKVGQVDGGLVFLDTALANWEYASAGVFGRMLKDLTQAEKDELGKYADSDITEFAQKVRVFLGNPSQG
jgi:hypothetical protein